MVRPVLLVLCLALSVSACSRLGQSWVNPLNWFGSSQTVQTQTVTGDNRPLVTPGQLAEPADGRVLVTDVTGLVIEQTPDGAIIRATGVAPQSGYYNAQLVRRSLDDGVLTYEFRAEPGPPSPSVGSVAARTLNVATTVASTTLDAVRTVRVIGDATSQIVSR
jgi:hypothetical protein